MTIRHDLRLRDLEAAYPIKGAAIEPRRVCATIEESLRFVHPGQRGYFRIPATPSVLAVASPAAGADWSVLVPSDELWEIFGWTALLTTAVAVGSRVPRFYVATVAGGSDGHSAFNSVAQAASLIFRYTPGLLDLTQAVAIEKTVPAQMPWIVPPGFRFGVLTGSI
ncbi:MAG: hypothetical protein ACRDGM_11830, partial [bacterium]